MNGKLWSKLFVSLFSITNGGATVCKLLTLSKYKTLQLAIAFVDNVSFYSIILASVISLFLSVIHDWMCMYLFCLLNSEWIKTTKKNCYIKPGLSWSASLVLSKPPSMENKKEGVLLWLWLLSLSAVFSSRLGLADSWNKILMQKAIVTLVIPTWFLEI